MLSMQALKSAEEHSTDQMLVRGWLIGKPVEKVEMAAEEQPAGASCPDILISVCQRQNGDTL